MRRVVVVSVAAFWAGCLGWMPRAVAADDASPLKEIHRASLRRVEVIEGGQGIPPKVFAQIELPDACSEVGPVKRQQTPRGLVVEILTVKTLGIYCAHATILEPKIVDLQVENLLSGKNIVWVNDQKISFVWIP